MKDLKIQGKNANYLHCSMAGSYYIPCEILRTNLRSYRIKYQDLITDEWEEKTIPMNEIEFIEYTDTQILDYIEKEQPTIISDCFGHRVNNAQTDHSFRQAVQNAMEEENYEI